MQAPSKRPEVDQLAIGSLEERDDRVRVEQPLLFDDAQLLAIAQRPELVHRPREHVARLSVNRETAHLLAEQSDQHSRSQPP